MCGLKHPCPRVHELSVRVTPCVGVWIETFFFVGVPINWAVTPCVGVWIETTMRMMFANAVKSHPAWVCGLKHLKDARFEWLYVTPCVGVWIETLLTLLLYRAMLSHPAWVCGLKPDTTNVSTSPLSHTLRGCVD